MPSGEGETRTLTALTRTQTRQVQSEEENHAQPSRPAITCPSIHPSIHPSLFKITTSRVQHPAQPLDLTIPKHHAPDLLEDL